MREEMLEPVASACPYCGAPVETAVDLTGGNQEYYEDCAVCCAPILFRIQVDLQGQLQRVELFRDDE